MQPQDATFFEPTQPFDILETRLPHWDQPGAFTFITFRLNDSLPKSAVKRWHQQRDALLRESGIDPALWSAAQGSRKLRRDTNSKVDAMLSHLPPRSASLLKWKLFLAWDCELNELHGSCCLRDSKASKIVADGFLKFNHDRYVVAAFVVLPNHVHIVAAFETDGAMVSQGAAWRKYFAREINKLNGETGHLWQPDQFDHLVRSPESFDRIRKYIIDNPFVAKLRAGEYRLYVSPEW